MLLLLAINIPTTPSELMTHTIQCYYHSRMQIPYPYLKSGGAPPSEQNEEDVLYILYKIVFLICCTVIIQSLVKVSLTFP